MYELKKIVKVFTITRPPSYKKIIYRAAVSQRLRNTGLEYTLTQCTTHTPHRSYYAGITLTKSEVFLTVHRRYYVEIKCQLDATDDIYCSFIACSTCFGQYYAHHQELESIIQMVAACGIWCFGFQVVGMVWS